MKPSRLSQDEQFRLTRGAAWACWITTIAGTVLRTAGVLPQSLALFIVIFMGFAIYFSLSLSRFKLSDTIREVFLTGLKAATSLSGRLEVKLREMHYPTSLRADLPAQVCHECAQRYPCGTVRVLDGEDVHFVTEKSLTPRHETGSI